MKKPLFLTLLIIGIVMLSNCTKEEENTPPSAGFTISPETGPPVTIFTFNASSSTDKEDLPATLQVRWDWESDGNFDTDYSTNKILNYQYNQPGTFQITLEVMDSENLANAITKSLIITGTLPGVTTDSVVNITANSAICGGNVTSEYGIPVTARGVCWSLLPNPTIDDSHTTDGSDTGTFVSNLTGLIKDTLYYVRAYATNSYGTAYGDELNFMTPEWAFCGDPITITHIEGEVVPVTKTVTYGTVTGIPGEPLKCWISSNLGSDHQATAVDDETEASAGWYWQFNRKQGYKHDGTQRTPNTAWISIIDEYSDWIAANDPCNLELDNGWRIPTHTEYDNIDQWSDWNGPWNSNLKLHTSGYLDWDGLLVDRGIQGVFWSNLQGNSTTAWYMRFDISVSLLAGNDKALGNTLRCIKD